MPSVLVMDRAPSKTLGYRCGSVWRRVLTMSRGIISVCVRAHANAPLNPKRAWMDSGMVRCLLRGVEERGPKMVGVTLFGTVGCG